MVIPSRSAAIGPSTVCAMPVRSRAAVTLAVLISPFPLPDTLSGGGEDIQNPAASTEGATAVLDVRRDIEAFAFVQEAHLASMMALERSFEDHPHLHLRMVVNRGGASVINLDEREHQLPARQRPRPHARRDLDERAEVVLCKEWVWGC